MTGELGRAELESAVRGYLEALDRLDVDLTLEYFAPTAGFVIQSDHTAHDGVDAVGEMWRHVFSAHSTMRHEITNLIVDDESQCVVTEQKFTGWLQGGGVMERYSIYVFEFDESGRFRRVAVWIDGETPGGR